MEVVLDDNGVLEYTKTDIAKTNSIGCTTVNQWKKDTTKSRKIILKGVRDHKILNLHGKETPFSMWNTFTDLFENICHVRKLALGDKIKNI